MADKMDLAELSRKSYLSEDWYNDQTPKWDELAASGWVFSRAAYVPCSVGIRKHRGRDSAEFRVDNELTRETINTRLLSCCEMFDVESSQYLA